MKNPTLVALRAKWELYPRRDTILEAADKSGFDKVWVSHVCEESFSVILDDGGSDLMHRKGQMECLALREELGTTGGFVWTGDPETEAYYKDRNRFVVWERDKVSEPPAPDWRVEL